MKIITSPPLVRHRQWLQLQQEWDEVICVRKLQCFFHIPLASLYYIELSRTQWADEGGWDIWLQHTYFGHWSWGRKYNRLLMLTQPAEEWLTKNISIPIDTPTRFYFRLTYED